MPSGACVVMTTCSDRAAIGRITRALLHERLAACVQALPVDSRYRWKGKMVRDREILLLIKTRSALYGKVEARIRSLHPYTIPEILKISVATGFAGYLQWISRECGPARSRRG